MTHRTMRQDQHKMTWRDVSSYKYHVAAVHLDDDLLAASLVPGNPVHAYPC